jgi:hypothetical protein
MYGDYLIQNTAWWFWEQVKIAPSYPCELERYFIRVLPLAIQPLPELDIERVSAWVLKSGQSFSYRSKNRPLCGCLLPGRPISTIFVDTNDSLEEQRMTIAHELAHFLFDYYLPYEEALNVLGPSIQDVLDGKRQPTLTERLSGVLAQVRVHPAPHLMERPQRGVPVLPILDAEDRADRLALELLAPAELLAAKMHGSSSPVGFRLRLPYLQQALQAEYGLSHAIAAFYAEYLLQQWGEPTVHDWLLDRD